MLGERHPSFALSCHNLAALYKAMGDYAAAAPLYRQALEICRTVLGERHPSFATNCNSLAALYRAMGDYAAAEPLCRQALEIRRTVLGESNPDFATSCHDLAGLYVAMARESEALTLMEQEAAINDLMIGQVFSVGSERQRMAYLRAIRENFDLFLSLVSQHLATSPTAVHAVFDLVLRRKAIGAEALAAQRDAVLGGRYPALAPQLRELAALRMQIAQKTLAGPGPEGLAAHQERLAVWNAQKDRLEAELARQIPEMNLAQKLQAADRQVVAWALPEGSTLVEFVRFGVVDFTAVRARGERRWQPARYLAFVLPAGEPDNVRMLDLGEAEPIDLMVATFRDRLTEAAGLDRGGRAPSARHTGVALRDALFTPLAAVLREGTRLLLAPDGALNRLPFEVLPTDDGRCLIDDYHISYLSTGRDVLRLGAASSGQPTAPLVAADPDFELEAAVETATHPAPALAHAAASRGRLSRDLNRDTMSFPRLPGTQVEGERIAALLGVRPWLGDGVLEAPLKTCRSPRILHLATHGCFRPDQPHDPNAAGDGMRAGLWEADRGLQRMGGPGMENPMLRSFLALAGVNTWLQGGAVPPEAEDGILTAEDVSGLDLLDTELVVLSACDTGLGAIQTGEGVFGLRRAFVLAGAKTLVMSLWKVPDVATAILMEQFYVNLLAGQGRSAALRNAQFYTRDVTVGQLRADWLSAALIERLAAGDADVQWELEDIAAQPDDYRPFSAPRYWGGFICQGDPSPLPSSPAGPTPRQQHHSGEDSVRPSDRGPEQPSRDGERQDAPGAVLPAREVAEQTPAEQEPLWRQKLGRVATWLRKPRRA